MTTIVLASIATSIKRAAGCADLGGARDMKRRWSSGSAPVPAGWATPRPASAMPVTVTSLFTLAIDGGYFYAGAVIGEGVVLRAAPIIQYMVGWTETEVRRYCLKKKWKIKEA